jgi:hypothetical protein
MSERPKILEQWDEVQHDPLTLPPDDFEGLSLEDAVERIKEWFFENFEDPVHSTPHDSAEGGYQYIWGGPYDTRDIIANIFADTASRELIEAAIEELESEGSDWVPHSRRLQPPNEEEPPEPPAEGATALHVEMLHRLSSLEETMAQLPDLAPGIGHNRPPEPIEALPLNFADRTEITAAVEVLKAQPIEPQDEGKIAAEAAETLKCKARKIGEWLAKQADTFVSEAVKEAGKEFGKWGTRTAIWSVFLTKLLSVHQIVGQWLSHIHLPF